MHGLVRHGCGGRRRLQSASAPEGNRVSSLPSMLSCPPAASLSSPLGQLFTAQASEHALAPTPPTTAEPTQGKTPRRSCPAPLVGPSALVESHPTPVGLPDPAARPCASALRRPGTCQGRQPRSLHLPGGHCSLVQVITRSPAALPFALHVMPLLPREHSAPAARTFAPSAS